ncbi:uncharacterized protein LOC133299920 [Gastrolobium bilobum]|uniref:uncharacterized protein LOC133299920 n=1 Tax=Gastrolobium bilobum TaxID=150636 RepID=UPI002AAFD206|nr:uncharacterized protein LOC133299920 [Gastrolobium bilobum]
MIELRNSRLVDQLEDVIRPSKLKRMAEATLEQEKNKENQKQDEGSSTSQQPAITKDISKESEVEVTSPILVEPEIQVHINLPFVDALEQMLGYVKFMKEILSRKRRLAKFENVALTQESSKYLLSKLPPKLEDLGSFTIPCTIGDHYIGKTLCDLGANINLMPMKVFRKLKVGEPNPTIVNLQLADRSIVYPEGKIENVLVKVDKFILPIDFIILDYKEDKEVPIILGRDFLAIGGDVIDVKEGEQIKFNILKAMKYPREMEECSRMDVIDVVVKEGFMEAKLVDPLAATVCESLEVNRADAEEWSKEWSKRLTTRSIPNWKNKILSL